MSACLDFSVRVYLEDTDAGGVVYHTNYLKYMERARTEFVQHWYGEDLFSLQQRTQIQFVVRRLSIMYTKPVRLSDRLVVKTVIEQETGARLIFNQQIVMQDSGDSVCAAEIEVVGVNPSGRACRLPKRKGEHREL